MSPKPEKKSKKTEPAVDLTAGAQCAECARVGFTCCQPAYGVSLTLHDARRLMDATGKPLEELCRIRRIKDEDLLEGLRVDKWFRRMFLGKDRLLQTRQGLDGAMSEFDCCFLGEQGCTAFEHRPRLCHLHPFWFRRLEKEPLWRFEFFYDAIDDEEEAEEADCLVVNRLWPDLEEGLASIGEGGLTLTHHATRMIHEIRWQRAELRKLKEEGKKLHKLKIADLAAIVKRIPSGTLAV